MSERLPAVIFQGGMSHLDEESQIGELHLRLKQLESDLQASRQQISQLVGIVESYQQQLQSQQTTISRIDRAQKAMLTGRIWRTLHGAGNFLKRALPVRFHGLQTRATNLTHSKSSQVFASDYQRWISEFEVPDSRLMNLKLPGLPIQPLFSILLTASNPVENNLAAAIQSVLDQLYEHWELCIPENLFANPKSSQIIEQFASAQPRIKVGIPTVRNPNGSLISGEYLLFFNAHDQLSPLALAYICEAINKQPGADLIYSDEDKIDNKGQRFDPFFKPDWSPDLLLSQNYIGSSLVLKKDLVNKLEYSHSLDGLQQDYAFVLQAADNARQIVHISRVLYHQCAKVHPTSSLEECRKDLEDYCTAKSPGTTVQEGKTTGCWRVRYPVSSEARVSIIIASGGKTGILQTNLQELLAKTSYRNFEIVVIDNSRGNSIRRLITRFQSVNVPVRYIDYRNQPFNYSAMNNRAARQCNSPIILFLNDDTSVITGDWLQSMVELIERPEVGAVGAKLLYPDGRIQHAGIVMGLYDNCGHAFKSLDGAGSHYFGLSDLIRNVSAVTGACLMTKRDIFWSVNGFDGTDFAIAFNDVDLCLKIGASGYRILYTPYALLYHHEAFSKTSKDLIPHPQEVARMQEKWADIIKRDPFYNPNLTRDREDYSLRRLD